MRLLMRPCSVRVAENCEPLFIKFNGIWLKVKWIGKRWRIKKGWWEEEKERDYFQIETEGGIICEIFKDLKKGLWFIEKIYD